MAFVGVLLSHLTGILIFDGIASIIIGLVLGGTAAWLAYETKSLLIGESATKSVIEGIRKIVTEQVGVEKVNEVLTMHMGPDFVLLNLSVEFKDETTATNLEHLIAEIDSKIKQAFPEVKRIFIEAETAATGPAAAPTKTKAK